MKSHLNAQSVTIGLGARITFKLTSTAFIIIKKITNAIFVIKYSIEKIDYNTSIYTPEINHINVDMRDVTNHSVLTENKTSEK